MNKAVKTCQSVLLFGYPLSHSLSPSFQNAAFEALSLPIKYVLHPLEDFVPHDVRRLLEDPSVLGANVTVPYKRSIFDVIDDFTPTASRVGAVNTVFWGDSERSVLVGDNTDVQGFLMDVDDATPLGGLDSAVILGAGGAARAVAVALIDRVKLLTVINRTPERAEVLVEELKKEMSDSKEILSFSWPENRRDCQDRLIASFERSQLIVDATSIGLGNRRVDESEMRQNMEIYQRLPWNKLQRGVLCYELKYGVETPFMRLARNNQQVVRDGLGMLIRQGALSFERWTGRTAPIFEMYEAVGLS